MWHDCPYWTTWLIWGTDHSNSGFSESEIKPKLSPLPYRRENWSENLLAVLWCFRHIVINNMLLDPDHKPRRKLHCGIVTWLDKSWERQLKLRPSHSITLCPLGMQGGGGSGAGWSEPSTNARLSTVGHHGGGFWRIIKPVIKSVVSGNIVIL